jgi:uncharacterized membrane protein YbhN (UPF0104 family)
MSPKKILSIQTIKPYFKYIGHVMVMISLFVLVKIIHNNLDYIQDIKLTYSNIFFFLLLILWGILGYILFSYTCVIQARNKYPKFTLLNSFKIIATTQIAKYLPGNVAHHIGRYYLSNKIFSSPDTLYFLFIENLFFVFAATTIGSFYFLFIDLSKYVNKQTFFIIGILTLFILPFTYKFLLLIKNKFNIIHSQAYSLLMIFTIFLFTSIQGGISIYIILKIILSENTPSLLLCISGFSISFLIGFIMPGAPAGIGVREYSFTLLFTPFLGNATALKAIIIFRLITTITDIVLYIIGKSLSINKDKNKVKP